MKPVARDPGGRVHLTVHRDSVSGAETVALAAPLFAETWQNDVAAAAAGTAHGLLAGAPTLEAVVALARNAMDGASRLIDGLLARAPAGAVACRAGCDHCCYQSVGVTPPEALAIFDHLSRTLSDAELERVGAHVAAQRVRTRGLSTAERFSPEHPCAFLDVAAGRCTIYEVRPLSCRGMNSLDAAECEKRLRDPAERARPSWRKGWAAIRTWSRSAHSTRSAPASSWACPSCTASTCGRSTSSRRSTCCSTARK